MKPRRGEARLNGYLEDYGAVAEGLLALYQATADPAWLGRAGDALTMGSRLRTGADSALTLRFVDGSQAVVTPQTDVTLERMLTYPATGGFSD